MNNIQGKKILFIGVPFYHYNDEIISQLKQLGASVEYYDERDSSLWHGLFKATINHRMQKIQNNHYNKILQNTKGKKFDYLLVIRGYLLQPTFIERVKQLNPDIRTILYQWDAYRNWECDFRYLIPHFDRVISFDFKDAEELGLEYVPTFSPQEYSDLPVTEIEYDMFYSGTFFYSRYKLLQDITHFCNSNGLKLYTHIVISKPRLLKERFQGQKLDASLLKFRNLSKKEYIQIFSRSNVIVDLANPNQTGLTMRTLDALMAGKKIATSNSNIMRLPVYYEKQIQIFDPENFNLNAEFVRDRTNFPKHDFSVKKWINQIFS